jgi:hypothetical protein
MTGPPDDGGALCVLGAGRRLVGVGRGLGCVDVTGRGGTGMEVVGDGMTDELG